MLFLKGKRTLSSLMKICHTHIRCLGNAQNKISTSYYSMPGDIVLKSFTLGKVLDLSADANGDDTAFISTFQGISKTFSDFRSEVDGLASGLISLGLKKGDRIGICSPNCYEWPLTQYAAAKAGLILVCINPVSTPKELEYCLRKVDCKALVIWDVLKTQKFYDILCEILPGLPNSQADQLQNKNLPNLKNVIMISDGKKDGTLNFKDVVRSGNSESRATLSAVEKSLQFDDPSSIMFTSGTTGTPKAALLSHHNLVNNSFLTGKRFGFDRMKVVGCCHLPLFHSFGCVLGSITHLMYGATCVFPAVGFDAVASLKAIEKYKCTTVFGTPTMFVDMLHKYQQQKYNLESLKQAIFGGAASPETLILDVKNTFNIANVLVGYGATELSPAVAGNRIGEDFENVQKANLEPFELVEVKVVDDKNQLVPVNIHGELCFRGHCVFMGYFNDDEQTDEVLSKTGWYHTGDIGVMNEKGWIQIVGRKKEMIIRGGENIYPQEVENYLNTHPAIEDAYVCGVPDARMGEEGCAWISLKKDMTLTEKEVKDFCKGNISPYKIPRYILFVKEFPKTPTGKVKKHEMTRSSVERLKV